MTPTNLHSRLWSCFAFLLPLLAGNLLATSFDLAAGFSSTSNPNGPWTYGWVGSIGGSFTPIRVQHLSRADGGEQTPSWQLTSFMTPAVYKNTNTTTITIGNRTGSLPPGTVWYYPGEAGRPENFGVIRFTVPSGRAGAYVVSANAGPVHSGPPQGDTDFHVVHNGTEVFGRFLAPGEATEYRAVLTIYEGDTIDFVIGRGADGSPYGSGLRIAGFLTQPPTVHDQSVTVRADQTAAIVLEASDPDGDALTYTVSTPAHGTLTGTAPNLVYHPALDYAGPDSFTYKVSDGRAESGLATVSIQVLRPNRAPVARVIVSPLLPLFPGQDVMLVVAANQNDAVVVLNGSLSSDADNDPLTYAWVEEGQPLPSSAGVSVTNTFELGEHHITLAVSDGLAVGNETVTFAVVMPGEAVEQIMEGLEESSIERLQKRPLLATLKATTAALDRGQVQVGINLLRAFQNKVRAQLLGSHPVLAAQLNRAAEQLIDALQADQPL